MTCPCCGPLCPNQVTVTFSGFALQDQGSATGCPDFWGARPGKWGSDARNSAAFGNGSMIDAVESGMDCDVVLTPGGYISIPGAACSFAGSIPGLVDQMQYSINSNGCGIVLFRNTRPSFAPGGTISIQSIWDVCSTGYCTPYFGPNFCQETKDYEFNTITPDGRLTGNGLPLVCREPYGTHTKTYSGRTGPNCLLFFTPYNTFGSNPAFFLGTVTVSRDFT